MRVIALADALQASLVLVHRDCYFLATSCLYIADISAKTVSNNVLLQNAVAGVVIHSQFVKEICVFQKSDDPG